MVQTMHPGTSVTYEYSFSDIPVSRSAPVVTRHQRHARKQPRPRCVDGCIGSANALKDNIRSNRIAMFGSYPKYSPLVFSSMLEQIQRRWAGAPEQALSDLWMWKRTRPLPASLAMSAAEQRAMVGGWFLGRLLGTVAVPKATHSPDPVQIWDFSTSQWLAFPSRLLTPPSRFRGPDDWLPAVLESHSLAIVQCNNDVNLSALKPYLALRTTFDDSKEQPHGTFGNAVGVRRLSEWISTGAWPSGQPSEVLLDPALASATPQERADAAKAWLAAVAQYFGDQYLTTGGGVGALERAQGADHHGRRALAGADVQRDRGDCARRGRRSGQTTSTRPWPRLVTRKGTRMSSDPSSDSLDLVIVAARRTTAVQLLDVLRDWSTLGLIGPVHLVDMDSVRPGELLVPATVLEAGRTRAVILQEECASRSRTDLVRIVGLTEVGRDRGRHSRDEEALALLNSVRSSLPAVEIVPLHLIGLSLQAAQRDR